jgi:hypothetical protein
MPWSPSDSYNDFVALVDAIENPLGLDVRVDSRLNNEANFLCFYTGTAIIGRLRFLHDQERSPDHWSRGFVRFLVPTPGRTWTFKPTPQYPEVNPRFTSFHGGTVVLSLATIFNGNVANNAGWAVDGADVYAVGIKDEFGLVIRAAIALRDSDAAIYRLAYQVTALGKGPILSGDPTFPTDTNAPPD